MVLPFTTFPLRCIEYAAKSINLNVVRPLSTNYFDFTYPESDAICNCDERFCPADLELFAHFLQHGSPDAPYLLNKIISSCAKMASFSMGVQMHSPVLKMGFFSNVFVSSSLVYLYAKCDLISSAHRLFDEIPERNVVTWNTLISGYLHIERPRTALRLFLDMLELGMSPTSFSLSAVLVGCSQLRAGQLGAQVHGYILKSGLYLNAVVGTGLIDMYSKSSNVCSSRRVFDDLPVRTMITWTSMVTGYSQNQKPEEAMSLFKEMQGSGLKSNHVTYNNLLSSFCSPDYLDHCKQVHCRIIQEGFESDAYVAVTLMTVYSECGSSLEDFCRICAGITIWDQISWNAAVAGFSSLGSDEEALKCFFRMRQAGVMMDCFTFTSTLKAIGNSSALENGKHAHALVFKAGYASNLFVQNGLVAMYSRCGAFSDSKKVFSLMDKHDLISWNSLLSGCSHHGYGSEVVELFEQMIEGGIRPNNTSFLAVLSACSHEGLLEKGLEYFEMMKNLASSEPPEIDHYACVVDLYGRAGLLREAEAFINSMPIKPGPSVYKALLSACQVHGNKEIAAAAAKNLVRLCPDDPVPYILLSNVFAAGGRWDDAAGVRKVMRNSGVNKDPGYSWV